MGYFLDNKPINNVWLLHQRTCWSALSSDTTHLCFSWSSRLSSLYCLISMRRVFSKFLTWIVMNTKTQFAFGCLVWPIMNVPHHNRLKKSTKIPHYRHNWLDVSNRCWNERKNSIWYIKTLYFNQMISLVI